MPSKKTVSETGKGNKTVKQIQPAGERRSKKKRNETFGIYIYKVLRQVHPAKGISKKAMNIMTLRRKNSSSWFVFIFIRLFAFIFISHSSSFEARSYLLNSERRRDLNELKLDSAPNRLMRQSLSIFLSQVRTYIYLEHLASKYIISCGSSQCIIPT